MSTTKTKQPVKKNLAAIYRNCRQIGKARSPLYVAHFEGGELDGREQPMYARSRSFPREFLNKRLHQSIGKGQFLIKDDYYVCTTPAKRVETAGEVRIYRNEPNYTLNLQ